VSERTELRKPQQSKSEHRSISQQSKSKPERDESVRSQRRPSARFVAILEAAGDKYVPNSVTDLSEEWQTRAIEAVGDKDVATPSIDLVEDWQRDLYEEFLVWRANQVMSE
jgi:hypothetical protein